MPTVAHAIGEVDFSAEAATLATGDIFEIREGTQVIDTNLDLSSEQLNGFRTLPNFRGQLGTSATPATVRVDNASSPTATIGCNASVVYLAAAGTGGITLLECKKVSGKLYIAGTGTIATMSVFGGEVEIGSGAIVTTLNIHGGTVYAASNATPFTTINMLGGNLVTRRTGTTINGEGGFISLNDSAASTAANVRGNCVFNHRSTGTVATCTLTGSGTYTVRNALTNPVVTTLNLNSANARYIRRHGAIVVTPGTTNNPAGVPESSEYAGTAP